MPPGVLETRPIHLFISPAGSLLVSRCIGRAIERSIRNTLLPPFPYPIAPPCVVSVSRSRYIRFISDAHRNSLSAMNFDAPLYIDFSLKCLFLRIWRFVRIWGPVAYSYCSKSIGSTCIFPRAPLSSEVILSMSSTYFIFASFGGFPVHSVLGAPPAALSSLLPLAAVWAAVPCCY